MLVGILADLHAGMSRFRKNKNGVNCMQTINYVAIEWCVDQLLQQGVGAILIAGDVFENPNPQVDAIFRVQMLIDKIEKAGVQLVMIGGNHDYSQGLFQRGYHSFQLLHHASERTHMIYDPEISELIQIGPDVELFVIPYKGLSAHTWESLKRRKKGVKRILLAHGVLDMDGSLDPLYAVPLSQARKFDLSILGHVHMNSLTQSAGKTMLVPGSPVPSKASSSFGETISPDLYTLNTDDMTISSVPITVCPHYEHIITDDINISLQKIVDDYDGKIPPVISVSYNGPIIDVDESIYKKALDICLNLRIQTVEKHSQQDDSSLQQECVDFWETVQKEHPEWYGVMKEILVEEGD